MALSAKAQAFSMDELLKRNEKQNSFKITQNDECSVGQVGDSTCLVTGEGTTCRHPSVIEVKDNDGNILRVELCQSDLWLAFHRLGTEMIITKTGRRMFPAVRVRLSGLKKSSRYRVAMDFLSVDKNKYRYVYHSSRWMISGVGDTMKSDQVYNHPESPMTGETITSQVISFEKIKLTNNERPATGQVSLLSMQKFQPRLIIEELKDSDVSNRDQPTDASAGNQLTVTFPQTSFIAVTAYQNQEITRLKIARNPFAKGFREAGKCRSSLEAMIASFGVVKDQCQNQLVSYGKRKLDDCTPDLKDLPMGPKQTVLTHPLIIDPRIPSQLFMYPPFLYQTVQREKSVSPHESENSLPDKTLSDTQETTDSPNRNSDCTTTSPRTKGSSPSTPLTPSSSTFPCLYQNSGSIHPAFPQCPVVQPSVVDPPLIAAHYQHYFQSSQVPYFMPSVGFPISLGYSFQTDTQNRTVKSETT